MMRTWFKKSFPQVVKLKGKFFALDDVLCWLFVREKIPQLQRIFERKFVQIFTFNHVIFLSSLTLGIEFLVEDRYLRFLLDSGDRTSHHIIIIIMYYYYEI